MKTVDLMATAPHMFTMQGDGVGYKANQTLVVDGGKIIAVLDEQTAKAEYTAEENLTLSHHMILPGFIDAHMHTGSNSLRGLAPVSYTHLDVYKRQLQHREKGC